MAGELGTASLSLKADVDEFERHVAEAESSSDSLRHALDALAAVANITEGALKDVKLGTAAAVESRVSAEAILSGVKGLSDESRIAALELDRVKLGTAQAADTVAAGDIIDHKLDEIRDNASRTRRALERVRLGGRNGVGIGPIGSGYGRVGVLGAAVGVGALTAPAAAPAAIGLLASIPTLAAGAAGALGVLALAFSGVFKAIGGDKKAFDDLTASQKQFVLTVRSLDGWLDKLKQTAANALFPGLTKGLKAALSPGTVNAITTAIAELGRALGAAGTQWGRYFGSARFQHIFGPLMQSAARNIGVLSDTFLHLFDALGVIARAAIPFTNWVVSAIDKGAKFADTWLRARDASGQLAGAMHEAQTSLALVAKLFGSLVNAALALGKALYPIAKIAVKDLTNGLNYLAGVIHRNQRDIRAFAGGALKVIGIAARAAADGIGVLWHGLESLIGHKAAIVAAIAAVGAVLLATLGPYSLAIGGAIIAIGLIKEHWKTIKTFFVNLGHEIVNAFKYAWYLLEKGALKAALAIVEPFSHLPSFLGGWARDAKNSMQAQLDRLHAPNMNWGGYAAKAGAATGEAWKGGFWGGIAGVLKGVEDALKGVVDKVAANLKHHHDHDHKPKPLASASDVFGSQPPFTTNTGSSSGTKPLTPAQRMQLHLQYVLDQTKLALENAQQGTKAWDRAVLAEEKALKAEIRYWDKRAHNMDLSLAKRDAALRKELAYEHELKSVVNSTTQAIAQAARANEAQFVQAFLQIQGSFASNAEPVTQPDNTKKMTTHLYETVNELRQHTHLLKKAADSTRFPGSRMGIDSTLAATS